MHKVYILLLCAPLLQAMQTAATQPVTIHVEAQQLQNSITNLMHTMDAYLNADEFTNLQAFTAFTSAKNDCVTRHRNLFNLTRNRNGLSQKEQHKIQVNFGIAVNKMNQNNLN